MKVKNTLAKVIGSAIVAMLSAEGSAANDTLQLEEVVVTARKRAENVQDVSISMSVLDAEIMRSLRLTDMSSISSLLPNVAASGGGQADSVFSIRGVSTTANNPGFETGIGLYVDEVYVGKSYAFMTPTAGIERIEVLRGPQGTLFGRNTIGGAINVVTKAPPEEFEAAVRLGIGNYNRVEGSLNLGGPLGSSGSNGSLLVHYVDRDGYLKDFVGDASYMDQSALTVRGKLASKLSERVDALFIADYYEDDNNDAMADIRGGALESLDPYSLGKRKIGTDFKSFGDRRSYGVSARFNVDLDFGQLVSITAHRDNEVDGLLDQDFSPANISFTGRRQRHEQFSQELRLQSDTGSSVDYVVGAYFYTDDLDALTTANLGPDLLGGLSETAFTSASVSSDAYAAFATVSFTLSDRWSLDVGGRYTSEDKKLDFSQALNEGAFLFPLLGIAIPIDSYEEKLGENKFSYNGALNFNPTEDILAYTSFARGYKAGGFNATIIGTSPDDLSFKAEYVDSYEIGLKTSWLDQRLRLNLSAFIVNYEDKQEQANVNTFFIVNNAASAEIKGFEVEMSGKLSDGLMLNATLGHTDATYDKYSGCSIDEFGDSIGCDGNRLQGAPEWTASVAAVYERKISERLVLSCSGDLTYRDDAYVKVTNDAPYIHEERTLVGARIGIADVQDRWRVTLWGANLTDERYEELSFDFLGTDYAVLGAPRSYGVEVEARFK